ncbi:MAG: hypothetical protein ACO2ZM_09785 [Francisellaceae bacterium]
MGIADISDISDSAESSLSGEDASESASADNAEDSNAGRSKWQWLRRPSIKNVLRDAIIGVSGDISIQLSAGGYSSWRQFGIAMGEDIASNLVAGVVFDAFAPNIISNIIGGQIGGIILSTPLLMSGNTQAFINGRVAGAINGVPMSIATYNEQGLLIWESEDLYLSSPLSQDTLGNIIATR